SAARIEASDILDQRGSAPRIFRNTVVFLAPDKTRLDELADAVRQHMAWEEIHSEAAELNLDEFQRRQAESKRNETRTAVDVRIPECFCWVLVPVQQDPRGEMSWEEIRVQSQEGLAERVSKRL